MRFVVDRHLGRLAKWLRTLGYDAYYDVACTNERLREECRRPDSLLVTTAASIGTELHAAYVMLVPKDDVRRQLRTVVGELHLEVERHLFERCVICNLPVEPVGREACRARVPERVFASTDVFRRCGGCGRIYWEGTHTRRLRARLREMLAEEGGEEEG